MLDRIKGNWPKFSIDLSGAEYGKVLKEMAAKYGPEQVDRGISQCRDDNNRNDPSDPPSVSELRYYIANARTVSVSHPNPCHICGAQGRDPEYGWVWKEWTDDKGTHRALDRCPEWKRTA